MANAISVHTTLESDTVHIPELLPFVGKRVQIIVVEAEARDRVAEGTLGSETLRKRTLGSLRGLLMVPTSFDDPLPATETR